MEGLGLAHLPFAGAKNTIAPSVLVVVHLHAPGGRLFSPLRGSRPQRRAGRAAHLSPLPRERLPAGASAITARRGHKPGTQPLCFLSGDTIEVEKTLITFVSPDPAWKRPGLADRR